jgi:hypothetical protein
LWLAPQQLRLLRRAWSHCWWLLKRGAPSPVRCVTGFGLFDGIAWDVGVSAAEASRWWRSTRFCANAGCEELQPCWPPLGADAVCEARAGCTVARGAACEVRCRTRQVHVWSDRIVRFGARWRLDRQSLRCVSCQFAMVVLLWPRLTLLLWGGGAYVSTQLRYIGGGDSEKVPDGQLGAASIAELGFTPW